MTQNRVPTAGSATRLYLPLADLCTFSKRSFGLRNSTSHCYWLAPCWLASTQSTSARVVRCRLTSGELLFTNQPCPATTRGESLDILQPMTTPGLSPSEERQLGRLTEDAKKSTAARTLREEKQRRMQQTHSRQAKACALVREQLKKLGHTLRAGYSLKDATALKNRQDELKSQKDAQC